jgi:methionyl-tRNA synthetase
VVLTNKYYQGIVPAPDEFSAEDTAALNAIQSYPNILSSSIERYRFREASQELMNLARLGNKYLADAEPWKVVKTDPERVQTIMYVALQISAALAVVSEPLLPWSSQKLKTMLNLDALSWVDVESEVSLLKSSHQIGEAHLLFAKIEDSEVEFQLEKLAKSKLANEIANKEIESQKETVSFEDFSKLDLRVGTIIEAKKMPKAKKLLVLQVDTGVDTRTIVSGIADSFSAEEVIGKRVTVLINLAPRALRGVESQGMILMTETADGRLVFVNPDTAHDTANGLKIR